MSSSTTLSVPSATPSCLTVTPDANGFVPPTACNAQWSFPPSFGAAVFFAIAFGLSLVIHIFQAFYFKKLKLTWVLIMGVLWETGSFATRAFAAHHQQSQPGAFVTGILLLLAPMWVNAFVYMVLGRMIYFFVPEQKIWGVKGIQIAKIFVWLDVASFITQLSGGAMISPSSDKQTLMLGIHIYMGGIGFQEACIVLFTAIAIGFYLTMVKQERGYVSGQAVLDGRPTNWRPLLFTLFATLALITMRIIFRLVEFSAGDDPATNPLPFKEIYVYVLDAAPMLLCCVLLNLIHPGRVLQGEGSEFPKGPTRKEKKAIKRAKKEEKEERKRAKKEGKVYVRMENYGENGV